MASATKASSKTTSCSESTHSHTLHKARALPQSYLESNEKLRLFPYCPRGHGKYTWTNGSTYEGGVVAGVRNGEGTLIDGPLKYVGQWVEGDAAANLQQCKAAVHYIQIASASNEHYFQVRSTGKV